MSIADHFGTDLEHYSSNAQSSSLSCTLSAPMKTSPTMAGESRRRIVRMPEMGRQITDEATLKRAGFDKPPIRGGISSFSCRAFLRKFAQNKRKPIFVPIPGFYDRGSEVPTGIFRLMFSPKQNMLVHTEVLISGLSHLPNDIRGREFRFLLLFLYPIFL